VTADRKPNRFKVGTRESLLARLQTDLALNAIQAKFPKINFEIIAVKAMGDKNQHTPLSELGGRGVFVKELEDALLDGRVDFVVHSLKDLPTEMVPGLSLAATLERADPRDVLVSKDKLKFGELPQGSRVATSSRRRAAQLSALRKDLEFIDIRGNIQTRLRKHDEGQCDAMVLAAAGLLRLELSDRISEFFAIDVSTPAVGQGALAIECRSDDAEVFSILHAINEEPVWTCTQAERSFLNTMGGGCSVPVGAIAQLTADGQIELSACVASVDGTRTLRETLKGPVSDPAKLGTTLAEKMLSLGAREIIGGLKESDLGLVSPP
jgi:hydroxymethylbilane synthase